MGMVNAPNLAGRQLVRELKRLRKEARLSQSQAGRELDYDVKKMSRIENGQIPDIHGFRSMLDVYGLTINEWEPYLDLWQRAKEKGWWIAHGFTNRSFPAVEHDACYERNFEITLVPGLLQTASYARSVFIGTNRLPRTEEWIENRVTVRTKRSRRLYSDSPLQLHALIDEYALRRRLDPALMREQLELILERATLPNVTVQVVRSQGIHVGDMGPLAVLSYPDPQEQDVAYRGGVKREEHPEKVRRCTLDFEHIAELALGPEDSVRFIKGLIA